MIIGDKGTADERESDAERERVRGRGSNFVSSTPLIESCGLIDIPISGIGFLLIVLNDF